MTHEEKIRLFRVYTLMELCVYEIDELIESKVAVTDVKMLAKRLSDTIVKKHKDNMASLWNVKGGEQTVKDTISTYQDLFSVVSKMPVGQINYFNELALAVINKQVVIEEEHKSI